MKRLKNKFLQAFFSCCLLFALLTAAQAAEPTRYEVNTAAELAEAALFKSVDFPLPDSPTIATI